MKSFYMMLSMVLMSAFFNQQLQAQNSYSYNSGYNSGYDLSDYLDLQAVASAFSYSDDLDDFERRLNNSRNPVSNLDLNNDGYIDYLRLVKFTDRNYHVILIQAVLGRDYFQDVATILIGRDTYNRNFVQFIGDPYLYGNDYIIEPLFGWEPKIVGWLWYRNTPRYVSPYFWGYYPSYYRVKRIVTIPVYIKHVHRYVSPRHDYRYSDRRRVSVSVTVMNSYERKDYWRNHPDHRFEVRHSNVRNSREIRATPGRNESTRRESPQRDAKTSSTRESSSRSTTVTTNRESSSKSTATTGSRESSQRNKSKEVIASDKNKNSQPARTERSSSSSNSRSSSEKQTRNGNNTGGRR